MRIIKRNLSSSKGFTLIEMALVISIVGIFMAAMAQIYVEIKKAENAADTRIDVAQVTRAIADFRSINGRYPCPASLTANYGDADYGRETNCEDLSAPNFALSAGVTAAGVAIVPGLDAGTTRVRVGAVPFRDLNIPEEQAFDGYRNRISYAITEPLAVSATFTPNGGAISIIDDLGNSAITPPNSAHFVVFSAGENGAGAYNSAGALNPCTAGTKEATNCDFTINAEFVSASAGNAGEGQAGQFDDEILFATHKDIPTWETPAGGQNIAMKPSGGIGVGASASEAPQEDMQVDGIVRAQDDPLTDDIEEGKVQTQSLCDYDSETTDCFASSLIGGELEKGGGMACTDGEFMIGIKNGAPVCSDDIQIRCPAGTSVLGIKNDGSLDCGVDPNSCPTTNVQICGETKALFGGKWGVPTLAEVEGGLNRQERYVCENGTWKFRDYNGVCSCPASNTKIIQKNCAQWTECGNVQSGKKTVEEGLFCPQGSWQSNTIDDSQCTCRETSQTKTHGCPNGFNKGNITETHQNTCNGNTPSCARTNVVNTCACEAETTTRNVNCPDGMDGRYQEERTFNCPGGSTSPGSWTGWTEVPGSQAANCKCTPKTENTTKACGAGMVGEIKVKTKKSCPSGETTVEEDASQCQPAPPVYCQWGMISSSGQTTSNSSGIKSGQSCDCGDGTTSCKKFLDGSTYELGVCSCK